MPNRAYVIGRGSNCNIRLADPGVSRTHLKVSCLEDKVVITDLSEQSGTFVNGEKIIKSQIVNSGDEIIAGETKIFLSSPGRLHLVEDYEGPIHAELGKLVGSWISNFFLKRVIGIGRTGLVFEAYDETKDRCAAVKVYSKRFTSNDDRKNQLIESTRAFSKVRGPHLVRLYQAGKNSKSYYYAAMNLIEGESLDCLIKRAGIKEMLDWQETWRCACQIAVALVTIHEHSLVHRNVTPSNIIRRNSDNAYLLGDFSFATSVSANAHLRRTEEFFSQVHFLPPERVRGTTAEISDDFGGLPLTGVADIRSDIFGLGATCYAMLTGKPPALGSDLNELVDNIKKQKPPRPTSAHMSVNEHFESIVMKMIEKNPEERFREPRALLKELYRTGRLNGLDI